MKSFTANHKIYDITDRDQHELLNIEIKYWNDLDNKDNTTHSHGVLQYCVIVIFSPLEHSRELYARALYARLLDIIFFNLEF